MDTGENAWAVAQAIENLLGLVDAAVPPEELEGMRDEARRVVFELCSTVILRDGKCDSGERELLDRLLNFGGEGEIRYLLEYTAQWDETSKTIPRFFVEAATRDVDLVRSILCEIQFIGNNVAISDGDFQAVERKIVRNMSHFWRNSSRLR